FKVTTLVAVNATPLMSVSVPALTEMLPVRLLLAVSASIPEPAAVKEPAPLMTPENVVVALLTKSVLLGDVARVAGPLKVTLLPAIVEGPLTTTGLVTVSAEVA